MLAWLLKTLFEVMPSAGLRQRRDPLAQRQPVLPVNLSAGVQSGRLKDYGDRHQRR